MIGYATFACSLLWVIAFLADLPAPTRVDSRPTSGTGTSVLVNLGLLGAFALHHSMFARAAVKRRLARVVPAAAGRPGFVLVASVLLMVTLWWWRPIPAPVWTVPGVPARVLVWVMFGLGWALTLSASFLIDHRAFFGLRRAGAAGPLYQRSMYALVRHPMMLGMIVALTATPTMTAGHLLFALAGVAYIAVGVRLEDRDLARAFGAAHDDYARRVPALFPAPRRLRPGEKVTRPG